jgi:hypothetical protein
MSSYSRISAEALLQSSQQMAQRIEELHKLRRLVREAEARALGDQSPRPRRRQQLRPCDTAEHAHF